MGRHHARQEGQACGHRLTPFRRQEAGPALESEARAVVHQSFDPHRRHREAEAQLDAGHRAEVAEGSPGRAVVGTAPQP